HDHSVKAGALPVIAVQVQPHAKLIERETQPDTVDHRRSRERGGGPRAKEEIGSYSSEQEDAVVQVMDVRIADMQVNVRHAVQRHQNADEARRSEGQQQAEEDQPGKRARVGWEHVLPSDSAITAPDTRLLDRTDLHALL